MTNVLHLPARPGAPVACDMSGAIDTPQVRLREYAALFGRALVRRERRAGAVLFELQGDAHTRAAVEDLARREAACCPFLGHRVEAAAGRVTWTISAPAGPAEAVLDALHALGGGEDIRSGAWPGASSPSPTSTDSPAGATSCAG